MSEPTPNSASGPDDQCESRSIAILYKEYKRAGDEAQRLLSQNEKVINIAVLILGGFAYFGIKESVPLLLLLIPPVFAGLVLYIANAHEFAMICRGYAASLEYRINEKIREPVLRWETRFTRKFNYYRLSTIVLIVLGVLVSFAVSVAALVYAVTATSVSLWWVVLDAGISFLILILAIYLLFRLGRLRDQVRNYCRVDENSPPSLREKD